MYLIFKSFIRPKKLKETHRVRVGGARLGAVAVAGRHFVSSRSRSSAPLWPCRRGSRSHRWTRSTDERRRWEIVTETLMNVQYYQ